MQTTDQFLDDLRARFDFKTDIEVSRKLEWKPQQTHRYRHRVNTFNDVTAIKVAYALDIEPAYVVACMSWQMARTPEAKAVWARVVRLVGAPAR